MSGLENTVFDYIVVGAGSAGCVVAARLSADAGSKVLLIEAGKDYAYQVLPDRIRDPGVRTVFAHDLYWPDAFVEATANTSEGTSGRLGVVPLARAVGGGSLVNGLHAVRGLPRDYDAWESLGVSGWRAEDVLPYFRRIEYDIDFNGPEHGKDGPIHIQRVAEANWSGLTLGVRTAMERRGIPRLQDLNSFSSASGIGAVPLNYGAEGRMTVATAYLTPQVRRRPNLKILSETFVSRILFRVNRATAVECSRGQEKDVYRSDNVILCAGAINSPAVLQRSGVGSGSDLQQWGIQVVADRPGVGRNLLNHPLLSVHVHLRPRGRHSSTSRPPCAAIARYSSRAPDCPPCDMLINIWERTTGSLKSDPTGRQIANLMLQLNKSFSKGEVTLDPSSPRQMPKVKLNLLMDSRDMLRMTMGCQFIGELLRDPAVSPMIDEIFNAKINAKTLPMMQDTVRARILSSLSAVALGGPSRLRRRLLSGNVLFLEDILKDSRATENFAFQNVFGGHQIGTCRMGHPSDSNSVTDSQCRLIGVQGVRVIDASIFPDTLTAGPSLPVIMAAEKGSDMALSERRDAKMALRATV